MTAPPGSSGNLPPLPPQSPGSMGSNAPTPSPSPDPTAADSPGSAAVQKAAKGIFRDSFDEGLSLLGFTPTSSPIMGGRVTGQISEISRLFESARRLQEATANTPLNPSNPGSENANAVYITKFSTAAAIADVVFKPGKSAAVHSEICYGISRIVGLEQALVPAKQGKANVIAREDMGVKYRKMTTLSGEEFLVNLDGSEKPAKTMEVWSKKFAEFEILSNGADEDDDEMTFIAPLESVYHINNKKVIIDGIAYIPEQQKGTDPIEFKLKADSPGSAAPKNPDIVNGTFKLVYSSEADSDEMTPVLVPAKRIVQIFPEDPDESENPVNSGNSVNFDREELQCVATKNKGGTYSLTIEDGDDSSLEDGAVGESKSASSSEDTSEFGDDEPHITVYDEKNDEYYQVAASKQSRILTDRNGPYVERNGQHYQIERSKQDGSWQVVGRDIWGMVQIKVENTFHTPKGAKRSVDIRADTPQRKAFYDRVDGMAFVEAFIATILLRPQDGKIVELDQSNVLFQARPDADGKIDPQKGKLYPVLIDLDETMPPQNNVSVDLDFVADGKTDVHPVRCGLLGFPHARLPLTAEQKALAIKLILEISFKRHEINQFLERFAAKPAITGISTDHIKACNQVIGAMNAFIGEHTDKDWTLQDLFFAVFPEYHTQWKSLGNRMPDEKKASFVGLESAEVLRKMAEE